MSGLTAKAIRRRLERGTIPSVLRDGVRRIPLSELQRQGLVSLDGAPQGGSNGAGSHGGYPAGAEGWKEVIDRLLAQERELTEHRLLSAQAAAERDAERRAREALEQEFHRERAELAAARARIAELEASPAATPPAPTATSRRWWAPWRRPSEASPASS
jgi:hypothetical protein